LPPGDPEFRDLVGIFSPGLSVFQSISIGSAVLARLIFVIAKKLAYYGHAMRKHGSCLEKEIVQGTTPGARRRGRPRTAWTDNIKTWTGLPVEESIRMTENRGKWS